MKIKIFIYLFFGLVFGRSAVNASPDPSPEGKAIFTTRCAACHSVNKTLTGPALSGIGERRSIEWIVNFVHSSQAMVKKGDKDAVALFEKFNRIPMPDHPDLTDENIKNIIAYIKSESKPVTEEKAPFAKLSQKRLNYLPLSITKDYELFIAFLVAIALLIAALLLAVHVRTLKG